MITSVNSSLKETAATDALQRHNTATLAAISLGAAHQPQENGLDSNEETEHETSIDLILGQRGGHPVSSDDSSSCMSGTPEATSPKVVSPEPDATMSPAPEGTVERKLEEKLLSPEPVSPDMTPDPEEAIEMEMEEKVENHGDGEATVTTMVTVACSSQGDSPDMEREEVEGGEAVKAKGTQEEEEEQEEGLPVCGGERGRSSSSTQILVTDHENTTLSVNLNCYDSDNTLSDEESREDLSEEEEKEEAKKTPSPQHSPKLSPQHSPVITIKEDRTGSGSSHSSNASNGSTGASKVTGLPAPDQRRSCK